MADSLLPALEWGPNCGDCVLSSGECKGAEAVILTGVVNRSDLQLRLRGGPEAEEIRNRMLEKAVKLRALDGDMPEIIIPDVQEGLKTCAGAEDMSSGEGNVLQSPVFKEPGLGESPEDRVMFAATPYAAAYCVGETAIGILNAAVEPLAGENQ